MVMLAQPRFVNDFQPEQAAQQLQILVPADHQLHQRKIINIQRENVIIALHWMEAAFPARWQRLGDSRAQDVGVVTVAFGEEALLADSLAKDCSQFFVHR